MNRYVFCTKHESGGLYWRALFNRFLAGTFLSNLVIALMVVARGEPKTMMLSAMVPIPILLLAFKFYCKHAFDNSIKYYTKGETTKGVEAPTPIDKESRRRDRVAVRFGHPALYQKLTVPMVHEKSKHLLSEVYRGRLDTDLGGTTGYSDVYSMNRMSKEHPGKPAGANSPFEFVSENAMDFENFKDRPEFSDEYGGDGSVYGQNSRPSSIIGGKGGDRGRSVSRDSERTFGEPEDSGGVTYPAGYHTTPSNLREYSPSPDRGGAGAGFGRVESHPHGADNSGLLGAAAPMGAITPYSPEHEERAEYFKR
jgi:hypothetical protein